VAFLNQTRKKHIPSEKHASNLLLLQSVKIMNGDNVTEEIKGIPQPADTIRQHISEVGQDTKFQLNDRVKRGRSLQIFAKLDESTDVSGLAQLIVR